MQNEGGGGGGGTSGSHGNGRRWPVMIRGEGKTGEEERDRCRLPPKNYSDNNDADNNNVR